MTDNTTYKVYKVYKEGKLLECFLRRKEAVFYCASNQTLPLPDYNWEDEFEIREETVVKDSINAEVIELIKVNAAKGWSEYGKTMDRTDLSLEEWLKHLRLELLDATVYVTKILQELEDIKALFNGQLKDDEANGQP